MADLSFVEIIKKGEFNINSIETQEFLKKLAGSKDDLLGILKDNTIHSEIKKTIQQEIKKIREEEKNKQYSMVDLIQYNESSFLLEYKQECLDLLQLLPLEYQLGWIQQIMNFTTQKSDLTNYLRFRGLLFEMQCQVHRINQGFTLDTMHDIPIEYVSPSTHKTMNTIIQNDVPLRVDGKIHIYETKNYPRTLYGHHDDDYKQFEKYQAAGLQHRVSGSTFEISGRVSPNFIDKIRKFPEIEVLYNFPLPSGEGYQIILSSSVLHNIGIYNNEIFSNQDKIIIDNINKIGVSNFLELLSQLPDGYSVEDIMKFTEISDIKKFESDWKQFLRNKLSGINIIK